jgi:phage shock protein C
MTSTTSPASRPRRLTRSSTDKMLGGVAGGLADYFDLDPVLVRVGFVVSTAFSGAGVLAYLAMLVVVPRDDKDRRPAGPAPLAA